MTNRAAISNRELRMQAPGHQGLPAGKAGLAALRINIISLDAARNNKF